MKLRLTFFTAIGLAFLAMSQSGYASGRDPGKVANMTSEYAGERCSTPPKGSGIIAGFFRGWEQTPFQDRGSGLMPVERYRCFKTMNLCKSWLKTMNYLYNEKSIDASMCTRF